MAFEELAPRESIRAMPTRTYPGADRDPSTRLFNAAKQVLPKRHWTDLEQALSAPNADKVCDAVSVYVSACLDKELAVNVLYDYKVSIGDMRATWTPDQTTTNSRLCDEAVLATSKGLKAYRALLVEIHGEKAVEFAEYLDRRRDRYGWNDYGAPLTLRDWDEDDGYYEEDEDQEDEDNQDEDAEDEED